MNDEIKKLLDIVFQLGFCAIGLGGFFLLLGFLGHYGIIAVLIAIIFLVFMIWLLYYLHPRFFPDTAFRELSEKEKEDRQELEITVNHSYSDTFDLCMQAFQSFESVMMDSVDQRNGTLTARTPVRIFTRYGYAQSLITIIIQKTGSSTTSVRISSICEKFSFPTRGKNLENITTIRDYIQNPQQPLVIKNGMEESISSPVENPPGWILKNPDIATKLSVIPGWGQIYTGQYRRGILIGIITIILILIPFRLAFMNEVNVTPGNNLSFALYFLPALILWIINIYDARESAKKVNSGTYPFQPARQDLLSVYPVAMIIVLIVAICTTIFFIGHI